MSKPDVSLAVSKAADTLARHRPGQFMRTFLDNLASQGDVVLTRLFDIATDEATEPKHALKAIDMILKLSNAQGVIEVALGLKKAVGRPGSESEREASEQAAEWADAINLEETEPGKFEQVEE